jgi:hypothetical protein
LPKSTKPRAELARLRERRGLTAAQYRTEHNRIRFFYTERDRLTRRSATLSDGPNG